MNNAPAPADRHTALTIAASFLAVIGWGGLLFLLNAALPTVGPRWLFFALWFVALTGTALPFVRYLNKRFAKTPPSDGVLLRQSIWVGLFGATCAWLQLGRALNWATGLLLAAALIAIEIFTLLRARSQWNPDEPSPTSER